MISINKFTSLGNHNSTFKTVRSYHSWLSSIALCFLLALLSLALSANLKRGNFFSNTCETQLVPPIKDKGKPNIIILYADDMGYGDLAIENPNSKIPTPYLDQLARDGIRFTDGHSSSGICTPSRYALLTGRYHWRDFHGLPGSMGGTMFKENQYTMAKMLKENGYATACIGKWHLGWDWDSIRDKNWTQQDSLKMWGRYFKYYPSNAYDWEKSIPDGPLDHGFDYYFGDDTINFPPYAFIENDKVTQIPTVSMTDPKQEVMEGPWGIRPGPAVKDWDFYNVLPTMTEKAVQYIKNQKDSNKPFFLYMPFPSPHTPIMPNEEFRGKSDAGPYGDYVYQTDWSSGQILNALDAIGATDNTIVIFTADNGSEKLAYERVQNYDHYSSAPFRGVKRDLYEGGHHVPFIVRWPNKIKAGRTVHITISQVDLLQTFANLLNTDLPKGLAHDSHDFSEVWLNENHKGELRSVTIQNTFKDNYAVRMGKWLYINSQEGYHSPVPTWAADYFGYSKTKDSVQLFDLEKDISQKINLASQMPEKVSLMQKELERIRKQETFIE